MKPERTASEVLLYICCQGLTEQDINGNEQTVAEVAADWGSYMFTCGMLLGAYMNGVITRREYDRAQALWYMLRYGNIVTTRHHMG